MSNDDEEQKNVHRFLMCLLVAVISGWYSFTELRYVIWGKQADAVVSRAEPSIESGSRGRQKHVLSVTYAYQDQEGVARSEMENLPSNYPITVGNQVKVSYLPGVQRTTRLSGRPHYLALISFFASVTAIIACIVWIARQANAPYAKRR